MVTLPPSPVTATFISAPSASVTAGSDGVLQLLLGNATSTKFTGAVTVTLYASTDNSLSSDDTAIATITVPKVNLRPGASKKIPLKFIYSTALSDGAYYILGSVSAGAGTASVEADALAPVTIAAPTVDLATSFGGNTTVTVNPDHAGVATIVIQNLGNVTAVGTMNVLLYGSAGPTLDFGVDAGKHANPRDRDKGWAFDHAPRPFCRADRSRRNLLHDCLDQLEHRSGRCEFIQRCCFRDYRFPNLNYP